LEARWQASTSYENFVCRINEEFINMFNNNETEVHIPLHRALRVRRGDRYQYYKNKSTTEKITFI
jgi:uncharacterized protein (UPF0248 family)